MIFKRTLPLCLAAALLSSLPVAAEGPGYVDGSAFSDLADEDSDLVEISIGGALLIAIGEGFAADDDDEDNLGGILRKLEAVNAVIVGVGDDRAKADRAVRLVRDTSRKLEHDGWERLAKIKEGASELGIYTRTGKGSEIVGLVVVGFDKDDDQAIFVNIAGIIDLAQIGRIGEAFDLPGLDRIEH